MSGKAVRETLAALGVIASLVFVGTEIRQNTLAQRSATIEGVFSQRTEFNIASFSDDGMISVVRQLREGATSAQLTADEVQRGRTWLLTFLRIIESAHRQVRLGVLDQQEVANTFESLSPISSWAFFQEQWPTLQPNFAPDFISYLEANLIQ